MTDPVDNSAQVAGFMPEIDDGDTFLYTELLDRSRDKSGGNRVRMLRSFHHRSREHFWEVWPTIQRLCDQTGARAYTRLSPRSHAKVGRLFAMMVMEDATLGRWRDMQHRYASACGRVAPEAKLWLWDVDEPGDVAEGFAGELAQTGVLVARIPSRRGFHLVTKPIDPRAITTPAGITLHRDNPTNLYIPATELV